MSFEATDKLIADTETAFNVLSQKIIGVQDDLEYRAITGTGGFNDPQLTGETKTTVDHAQSLVGGLWVIINLLSQRLKDVKEKRAAVKTGLFSGSGAALQEIEDLLKLHNLEVTAAQADKMPAELKNAMFTQKANTTSFQVAVQAGPDLLKAGARAIIEVNACILALKGHLAETETKLNDALPTVTKTGGAAKLAHSNAVAALAKLKTTYEHDPLGVKKGFDQTVGKHIGAINQALDAMQHAKEKAHSDMGDAKVLMQRMEDKQPQPARIGELRDWLTKLNTRLDQEEWASASAGLADWIKEASTALSIKPPAPSYQPPKPPERKPQPPQSQTDTGQTHTPQSTYTPPAYTPPYGHQVPTSADYKKYEPKEKSNLEKLLDGELAGTTTPAPSTVTKPVDPEVEKLMSEQTKGSTQQGSTTQPSAAVDALVNGHGQTGHTTPPQQTVKEPVNNAALDALVNDHGKPAATTTTGEPAKGNAALDALVNDQGKPATTTTTSEPAKGNAALDALVNKPAGTTGSTTVTPSKGDGKGNSAIEDMLSDKPKGKTQPPPPPPPTDKDASSGKDSSNLSELIDGKKKTTPPPDKGKAKDVTPPPPATGVKPAATQADTDAAQRKALEDLLKG